MNGNLKTYLCDILLHPPHSRPLISNTNVQQASFGELIRSTESKRIESVIRRHVDDRLVDRNALLYNISSLVQCAWDDLYWRQERGIRAQFETTAMTCMRQRSQKLNKQQCWYLSWRYSHPEHDGKFLPLVSSWYLDVDVEAVF